MARSGAAEVAIGVVGPHDLVERIVLMARADYARQTPSWRLLGAAYRDEHDAAEQVARIQDDVDVLLFTGPLPYDIAQASGELERPATYVPLNGASLFSTMLRAVRESDVDLARVSIDSLAEAEVHEAYAEVGLPLQHVQVREYVGPSAAAAFAAWHADLYQSKQTSAAFTTVRSVARELEGQGVPAVRVLPATSSLRVALNTAALIGSRSRLEAAQIVVAIVGLPPESTRRAEGYGHREIQLAVHQVLLREARLMGATVLPRDERTYFVAATLGAMEDATDGFRTAPLVAEVREAVGAPVAVGIGLASTARDAEKGAVEALDLAWGTDGDARCCVRREDGTVLALPVRGSGGGLRVGPRLAKGIATARRLADELGEDGGGPQALVVDAEATARVLDVSLRTARRVLGELADDGLAWPMPPSPAAGRGRPRRLYRLVVDDAGAWGEPE